jgi:SAM-dependent MidA family methyltransferase
VARARRDGADGTLALCDRPLADAALVALAQARFPADIDYVSEINPAAEALVADLARRLAHGAMLVLDYGYTRDEYYHPQRSDGTLMGHYRHRAHADPLWWPGLSDPDRARRLHRDGRRREAAACTSRVTHRRRAFLLGCGILDLLARTGAPDRRRLPARCRGGAAAHLAGDMGERFKVLALGALDDIAWPGFSIANRADRL